MLHLSPSPLGIDKSGLESGSFCRILKGGKVMGFDTRYTVVVLRCSVQSDECLFNIPALEADLPLCSRMEATGSPMVDCPGPALCQEVPLPRYSNEHPECCGPCSYLLGTWGHSARGRRWIFGGEQIECLPAVQHAS